MQTTESRGKLIPLVILVTLAAIISYYVATAPDRRSTGERISDAFDELPSGVDNASRQLKDRTPGEKLQDAAKDAGESVKKATNQ